MGRVKAGELSLSEIRNLARQHNKINTIKNISTLTRAKLIAEIERMGYTINHEKKMIKKKALSSVERSKTKIKVGSAGAVKPQKRTVRKALVAGGPGAVPPVMKKTKHPPIKPALKKQRKKKAEIATKRKKIIREQPVAQY
jgi:GTPase